MGRSPLANALGGVHGFQMGDLDSQRRDPAGNLQYDVASFVADDGSSLAIVRLAIVFRVDAELDPDGVSLAQAGRGDWLSILAGCS